MSEPPTPPDAEDRPSPWQIVARALVPRASRGQLVVALLCALLGFGVVTQVRSTQQNDLSSLRQEDLVRLLEGVTQQADLLEQEATQLRQQEAELTTGTDRSLAARDAAERSASTQGILAGRLPAQGPGLAIEVYEGSGTIKAAVLFNILEELRNAGAEAIQLEDRRITASSYIIDTTGGVIVDGAILSAPYTWLAIGAPQTMASVMEMPGGALPTVRALGGEATIEQRTDVVIDATRAAAAPRYATAVPADKP